MTRELPDESLHELYEEAPCGYLSLLPAGEIVRVNRTFLDWTGYRAEELLAGQRFTAVLTAPSALLYETHCAPLLRLRGSLGEIALDIQCRDGQPLPVLLSATAKKDPSGALLRFRIVVLNSPTRREYERELLRARRKADEDAEKLRCLGEIAERKVADQNLLLQEVSRMAAGNLEAPVSIEPGSGLIALAEGLDHMRQDILQQIHELKERNAEVSQLNRELRHQIERRSEMLVESMLSRSDEGSIEVLPVLAAGMLLARRYRIGELLGQGAMGTVYQVERVSDGRTFAAKILGVKPDYQARARFAREAQLLARLQHPNLISIVDADVTEDRVAYIIMELTSGKSLVDFYSRYRDRDFMLPILYQIADALTAVHAAGVVHRDLKPGNVLIAVSADGTQAHAKLVDFGVSRLLDCPTPLDARTRGPLDTALVAPRIGALAPTVAHPLWLPPEAVAIPLREGLGRRAEVTLPLAVGPALRPAPPGSAFPENGRRPRSQDELTQAGMLLGTLLYMAPELRGGANLAHPPADIFSFGVMTYEVLTGVLPFEELPLLRHHIAGESAGFPPLDSLCPGLSGDLARILEACLSMDPSRRPTAVDLVVALNQALVSG